MITFESPSQQPNAFQGFVGVIVMAFEGLLERAAPLEVEGEGERLERPACQGAIWRKETDACLTRGIVADAGVTAALLGDGGLGTSVRTEKSAMSLNAMMKPWFAL